MKLNERISIDQKDALMIARLLAVTGAVGALATGAFDRPEKNPRNQGVTRYLSNTPCIVDEVVVHNALNGQPAYAEMFFRDAETNRAYHAQVPERNLRESAYRIFTNDTAQGAESRIAISGNVDDLCVHGYNKARDIQVTGLEDIE